MVPKVAGKGRSFKGAGMYYLHDKDALTNERVAFTHTLNLATDDAEKAIGWMAHTAMRQAEIKQAAGGVAKGRKLRDPVYAYSLSWAPDETPTQAEMIAAGIETIERLGLYGHEALLVAHKDEPHPHLHVIINRVHPETGVAAPLSNDHLKLSEWAEAFELKQGKIRCEQRVENNRRRKHEYVKYRDNDADFYRWRKARLEADFMRRETEKKTLTARQHQSLEDLIGSRKAVIEERRRELKEKHRPAWSALFERQRDEKYVFEQAQKSTFGRLRYWLKNREIDRWAGSQLDRQGMLSRAFNVVVNSDIMRKALADKQEAERKAMSARLRQRTEELTTPLRYVYDDLLKNLRRQHSAQNRAQREQHSKDSQAQARAIAKGADKTTFEFSKAAAPEQTPPLTSAEDFGKAASSKEAMQEKTAADFKEAVDTPPAEPAKEAEEGKEEKRGFSAFRDLRDGKDQDRDDGRRRGGRERSIKPPGSNEPDG